MPDRAEYLAAWDGEENTVPYPRRVWMDTFRLPAEVYPRIDFLPIDMSVVYTAYFTGDVELYDQVTIQIDEDRPEVFMIVGRVPEDANMWFVFDTDTGAIMLLDNDEPGLELVNSTFAHFVDFLYHFGLFIDADEGIDGRAPRAARLKETLMDIDPAAFADPESWWSAAFAQLEGAH